MPAENLDYLESLYAVIYGSGLRWCPVCGTTLHCIPSRLMGAFGRAECHTCGTSQFVARHNDPKRDLFRPYTDDEKLEIIRAYEARVTPLCPIDGADMTGGPNPVPGKPKPVFLQCPRCGHSVHYDRAKWG